MFSRILAYYIIYWAKIGKNGHFDAELLRLSNNSSQGFCSDSTNYT